MRFEALGCSSPSLSLQPPNNLTGLIYVLEESDCRASTSILPPDNLPNQEDQPLGSLIPCIKHCNR